MNETKKKTNAHKIFIVVQILLVVFFAIGLFVFYPRADLEVSGNTVMFDAWNAEVIILSMNPDFTNPRYVDIEENVSFSLKPGTYYWKASNGILEGFEKEFEIKSEVGLEIIAKGNEKELKNLGNVKVNVSRTREGGFVGYIILEPDEDSSIEDEGEYIGRQDEGK